MSKENNKNARIKVRLSEEENEKLKRYSAMCGLSQSEFIRQLCKEIECLILELQEAG